MPGYRPQDSGLRELGRSDWMKQRTLEVARKIEGNANAVGDSEYESSSRSVRAGWSNEQRQGAVVRETDPHWRDWRDAVLVRVVAAMAVRGGRR